jgi:hypothetical protein
MDFEDSFITVGEQYGSVHTVLQRKRFKVNPFMMAQLGKPIIHGLDLPPFRILFFSSFSSLVRTLDEGGMWCLPSPARMRRTK